MKKYDPVVKSTWTKKQIDEEKNRTQEQIKEFESELKKLEKKQR